MYIALVAFHLIVALALVAVVLLQGGKGADIGAAFGGGASQTVFGSRGATTFLAKLTTAGAILFMLTSLGLAVLSAERRTASVITEDRPAAQAPAPARPAPAQPAPTPPAPAK